MFLLSIKTTFAGSEVIFLGLLHGDTVLALGKRRAVFAVICFAVVGDIDIFEGLCLDIGDLTGFIEGDLFAVCGDNDITQHIGTIGGDLALCQMLQRQGIGVSVVVIDAAGNNGILRIDRIKERIAGTG